MSVNDVFKNIVQTLQAERDGDVVAGESGIDKAVIEWVEGEVLYKIQVTRHVEDGCVACGQSYAVHNSDGSCVED